MYHYTYLLQERDGDMMYIGVRSSDCMPHLDNYWGSSKYLPENVSDVCDKFILGMFDTREEANQDEIDRHAKNKVASNSYFWNKSEANHTAFCTKGVSKSEEHRKKLSEALKGRTCSEETRKKLCESRKHRVFTEETKAKMSKSHLGKKFSEKTKLKMSKSKTGITLSEKHKKNISKGCSNIELKTITCPHCNKSGKENVMYRWHFDNCKLVSDKRFTHSEETRAKISKNKMGSKHTLESRQKMSISTTKYWQSIKEKR